MNMSYDGESLTMGDGGNKYSAKGGIRSQTM